MTLTIKSKPNMIRLQLLIRMYYNSERILAGKIDTLPQIETF